MIVPHLALSGPYIFDPTRELRSDGEAEASAQVGLYGMALSLLFGGVLALVL